MSNIKSCQCQRFPSGSAMSASERSKQKANIQIFKNNNLLNCNKQLSTSDLTRRVYSGTQNRLRAINGYKLNEVNKANANCGGNARCIFSDKKGADYWIMKNPDDNYKYTRITTNPNVEVLVKGPLNKAVLQDLANKYNNPDFLNPTEIIIGTEVTEISSDLFDGITAKRLTTLGVKTYLMNKCTSIGDGAFQYCTSLTTVTIGNSVTSIGDGAFFECFSLKSITIPNSVTSIGEGAFGFCTSLTSITIGNSVTSIGEGTFLECSSLTSVTIGNSVTSIGNGAFAFCSSLTSITIPNSVTSIGEGAFETCTSLTSIIIPDSVTSIGEGAFFECTSLTSVTFKKNIIVNINNPYEVWKDVPISETTTTFPSGGKALPNAGSSLSLIYNINLSLASDDVVFSNKPI